MAEGTTTLSVFTGRVLTKLGIKDAEDMLHLKIKNELNIQVAELIAKIKKDAKNNEFYTKESTATFINNLFSLRGISDFESLQTVRENAFGDIKIVDWDELENLIHNANYDDEFRCATYDKQLKLFVGRNLTTSGKSFYVKYSRLASPVIATTDKIDVPDEFIEQLLNSVSQVIQVSRPSSSETKKE